MNIIIYSHHKFCTGSASLPDKFHYTGMSTPTFIISIEEYSHQHSHHKFCTGPASLPGKFHYTGTFATTIIISIDVYSITVHIKLLPNTAPSTYKYHSSVALQYSSQYISSHHNSHPAASKYIDIYSSADAKSTT